MNLAERLKGFADRPDECWLWPGGTTFGYGRTNVGNGKRGGRKIYVHVAAYELLRGPKPKGTQLDHLCRNRRCMNPRHLEPVTCRENLLRGDTHAAKNARKTHCKVGHEFTAENTYTIRLKTGETERSCKACAAARYQRRRASGWRQVKGRVQCASPCASAD